MNRNKSLKYALTTLNTINNNSKGIQKKIILIQLLTLLIERSTPEQVENLFNDAMKIEPE